MDTKKASNKRSGRKTKRPAWLKEFVGENVSPNTKRRPREVSLCPLRVWEGNPAAEVPQAEENPAAEVPQAEENPAADTPQAEDNPAADTPQAG